MSSSENTGRVKLAELAIGTEVTVSGKIVGLDLCRYDEDGKAVGVRTDGLVAVEVLVKYEAAAPAPGGSL